jgi:hypothetical protein
MTSPHGEVTLVVEAMNVGDALDLAVKEALKRPDVWHILETGTPQKVG